MINSLNLTNIPKLEFDGPVCHFLLLPLLLQSESCGWKNCLVHVCLLTTNTTTKLVRHGTMAAHPKTEIRDLGHLLLRSNMPAGTELLTVETRPCQCAENSPSEKDLFSKPLSENVSMRETNENPPQHRQLPGGWQAHNSQD